MTEHTSLRRAVAVVAAANLGFFGLEFAIALAIGSVSLLADSADFVEDATVNGLILFALGWSDAARARLGMALSAVLLLPAGAFLWTLWNKLQAPVAPDPIPLSLTGAAALTINLGCAFLLARYRGHAGSLSQAAFLSARNDAIANVAIIVAGGLTALTRSLWPDLAVGLGIAAMNADAARAIWTAAREEHRAARVG